MTAARPRTADHVTIGDGGRFQCNHCGASYNPHGTTGVPVEIGMMAAISKAFVKQHRGCRAPARELCPFCFSPEHRWQEHINATVKTAREWPTCGDTGLSSRAIWRHMMGAAGGGADYPLDPSDFGRCSRLLAAPWAAGWAERMGEMAQHGRVWKAMAGEWAGLEALYQSEVREGTGNAPRLYARMRALRGEP